MTDDATKEVKNLATDTIKSRLNHPIIGTLFLSFLLWNWDKLLTLVLEVNHDPIAIEQFKDSLCKNFGLGYLVPIAMTILIPFYIEPWLNSRLQIRLAESQKKTKNRIEKEENETNSIAFEKSKFELSKLRLDFENLINNYKNHVGTILDTLPNLFGLKGQFFIFQSHDFLVPNQYVSLPLNGVKIIPFTKDYPMIGKVFLRLNKNFYLIHFDREAIQERIRVLRMNDHSSTIYLNTQSNEIKSTQDSVPENQIIDHPGKKIRYSLHSNGYDADYKEKIPMYLNES